MIQSQNFRIFSLDVKLKDPLQNKLFSMVKGPIEHVLSFPRLNEAYADVAQMKDNRPFPEKVLDRLNVTYDLSDRQTQDSDRSRHHRGKPSLWGD